jgi:hypothetical protein
VPGPDGGLGHDGSDGGYPFERPRGPGPVKGQKGQLQLQPGLGVITSHPGIAAPAAGVRQGSRAAATGMLPPGGARAPVLRSPDLGDPVQYKFNTRVSSRGLSRTPFNPLTARLNFLLSAGQ